MNRRYYSISLKLISSLSLSSGNNDNSDSDVLIDSRGNPYIPATSIAGVIAQRLDLVTKKRLYGSIDDGKSEKSHVIFYDAVLRDEAFVLSVRDSVALENKVSKESAKFDFEIVEPGVVFDTFIEFDDNVSEQDEQLVFEQLCALHSGVIRFGKKTTRGYGQVKVENIKRIAFSDVDKWLDFDMYDSKCWDDAQDVNICEQTADVDIIKLDLELKSALSIRSYTTELPESTFEKTAPDYKFLSLRNGIPVIPGTSWAGAFRERFGSFTGKDAAKDLFGYVDGMNAYKLSQKSKITFSESVFDKNSYTQKLITRNSIDRFSAATNDGALYTELTIYGGTTSLEITMPSDSPTQQKAAVYACISDLDNGFMAIGGLAAVGRGLFEVKKIEINGVDRTDDFKNYNYAALTGGEQG